MLPGAVRCGE